MRQLSAAIDVKNIKLKSETDPFSAPYMFSLKTHSPKTDNVIKSKKSSIPNGLIQENKDTLADDQKTEEIETMREYGLMKLTMQTQPPREQWNKFFNKTHI